MRSLWWQVGRAATVCAAPVLARAARSYVAGPDCGDALRVAGELASRGFSSTLGFWDGDEDDPDGVAAEYQAALDALTTIGHDSYLSIKLPALGETPSQLFPLLRRARLHHLRIHFDSLCPTKAEAMWAVARAAARHRGAIISASVPGRWRRSLGDVDLAIDAGIVPRIVKGQWRDPEEPDIDLRQGFLAVVDRAAGRAPRIAIATHDAPLAEEAIVRLQRAATDVEIELLYGLPERPVLQVALAYGVPVRFYVPYGRAYLPYSLSQICRRPRLLLQLARDAVAPRTLPLDLRLE
jgi:proline dehydrogenase